MPPILYLIDGHALAYRTYYALTAGGDSHRFQTHSGEPTAGTFGFASVLLHMLEVDRPEYMAVAFDTGKTFRDQLFPEYKATRAKMPDDLRSQIERIRQMVDAFGLPRLEAEGFEADDVLGSIARYAVGEGLGVKIITGDRDLFQLVDARVMVRLSGGKLTEAKDFTAEDVMAYWGVRPDQVVDYKALVGDTSDNIPGVRGIGEKTAVSLLQQYPTLEEIYAHLGELPERVRSKLEAGREMADLSRDLATIRTDVKIQLKLEQARTDQINFSAVEEIFRQLEFRALLTRLEKLRGSRGGGTQPVGTQNGVQTQDFAPAHRTLPGTRQLSLFTEEIKMGQPPAYELHTRLVQDEQALADLVERLSHAAQISFDTETTGTDALRADLVGISLSIEPGEGYYIPVGHTTGEPQLALKRVLQALRPAMTDARIQKIGHNIKFDAMVLARSGLSVQPLSFDTMLAEWVADSGSHNLGLKDMAEIYLGARMTHIQELIGKGKNQRTMAEVPVSEVAPYAAADAEVVMRLLPMMIARLEERGGTSIFREIEMPLVPVLIEMEECGVGLDLPFFSQMSVELTKRMGEISLEMFRAVGYEFNINSTQQLSKVLFDTLRLPPPDRNRRTASGHYSTSADVLDELSGKHVVVDMVLEYRELAKLKSTYVDALPLQINPNTGRVHTSFNQIGSVTGRLSSSEPNLQNIPTRTELGRRVRNGFVAAPGWQLLAVDYSQIELRIVAHMAGDEAMLAAFRAGQDIHAATAAAIFNLPLNQVTKDQRRRAKAINFGLIYGMGAFGLSRTAGLTLAEAEDFVLAYFRQFPGVKKYLDGIRLLAAKQGYVETLLGRRRYFPNLQGQSNSNLKAREEREAINAPVQGTAADVMKLAMIHLPDALRQAKLSARFLLQVHDELVLEVPQAELDKTARLVQRVMSEAYPLSIPLLTEARTGPNWGTLTVMD
ncbi:MAG TPA: DNA polymerase I [Anaerolineaceae bacterium]|nr:DNA polymerase I [Anaerolineaceae bacterium]